MRLLVALLFLLTAATARAETPAWQTRAAAAAETLDRVWGKDGGWNASENWQRFPITDILIDYQRRTADLRWSARMASAVRNRDGRYLNDDDLWAVICLLYTSPSPRD